MKSSILLVTAVAFFAANAHAQVAPLKISQVPASGVKLTAFAPTGWKIEKQINGDLNRDNIADAALVLVRNIKDKDAQGYPVSRPRALVVALKNGKSWRRAGVNNTVLMGTHDGGAFWGVVETPVEVSIKRGILVIDQTSGSRETFDTTHRFRYYARKKGFFLIGFDSYENDRLSNDGKGVSTNFLTGVSLTTTSKAGGPDGKSKKSRVSTKLRPFESVRVEERYAG